MCGIAGYINFQAPIAEPLVMLDKLFNGINHRGRDDSGSFVSEKIVLQHVRLSIIDLKSGHQPMFSLDQRYVIVFNGEIFNYESIRNELIGKGYQFKTASDTEVLLNAYIEWKELCLLKFNGFWAFCIYDTVDETAFISRDRFGIKPLFYKKNSEQFVFSSEISAILNVSPGSINRTELWDEIVFGAKNGGATAYNDIYELEAGSSIFIHVKSGCVEVKRYYDIYDHFTVPKQKPDLEEIEFLLKDSIKLRLRSDVPLGTLNSGGLDSSLISAIVKKEFKLPLHTFSAAPDLTINGLKKDGDESYFAELLAHYIKSDHQTIRYSDKEYFGLLDFVNESDGSFMVHPNTVALYIMLKYIREEAGIKVLLGGDGADEIFRGYSNNTYADLLVKTAGIPLVNTLAKKYFRKKFKTSIVDDIYDKYPLIDCLSIAHSTQRINGNKITEFLGLSGEMSNDRKKLIEKAGSLSDYDKVIYYEQSCYLQGHFKRVDRMSMRAGIEIRLPFMDYRLVENLNKIHFRDKFSQGEKNKKKLLKKIGTNYLPAEIINRTKKGFSAPIDHYRKQMEVFISEKYNVKGSDLGLFKNQELFILMNVLKKYKL